MRWLLISCLLGIAFQAALTAPAQAADCACGLPLHHAPVPNCRGSYVQPQRLPPACGLPSGPGVPAGCDGGSACSCQPRHIHVRLHEPLEQAECAEDRELPPPGAPRSVQPAGAFVAAPRTGRVEAPTRTFGLRGLAIHFPAMTLRLPSIELPTITRHRSGARMLVEASTAPYIETQTRESMMGQYGQQMPAAPRELVEYEREVPEGDERDFDQPQQEQACTCDACAAHGSKQNPQEYQRRLEELWEMERRLKKQMEQVQGTLEELSRRQLARPSVHQESPGERLLQPKPSQAPAPLPPPPPDGLRSGGHSGQHPSQMEPAAYYAPDFTRGPGPTPGYPPGHFRPGGPLQP